MAAILESSKESNFEIDMHDEELVEKFQAWVAKMSSTAKPTELYVQHPKQPVVFWFTECKVPMHLDKGSLGLMRYSK